MNKEDFKLFLKSPDEYKVKKLFERAFEEVPKANAHGKLDFQLQNIEKAQLSLFLSRIGINSFIGDILLICPYPASPSPSIVPFVQDRICKIFEQSNHGISFGGHEFERKEDGCVFKIVFQLYLHPDVPSANK